MNKQDKESVILNLKVVESEGKPYAVVSYYVDDSATYEQLCIAFAEMKILELNIVEAIASVDKLMKQGKEEVEG